MITLFLLALGSFLTYKAYEGGEFQTLKYHDDSNCRVFAEHLKGAEDIKLWQSPLGEAYVFSSDDRGWMGLGMPSSVSLADRLAAQPSTGGLFYVFVDNLKQWHKRSNSSDEVYVHAIKLQGYDAKNYHPLGIEIVTTHNDMGEPVTRLFSTVYSPSGNGVLIFDLRLSSTGIAQATLIGNIFDPLFPHPNAVAAVSSTSIFVSNWLVAEPGTMTSTIEVIQKQPASSIVHCAAEAENGKFTCKPVATDLYMVNGLAYDSYAHKLYYAQPMNKTVSEAHWTGRQLRHLNTMETHSACDNLAMHPSKRGVLAGCHPKQITFLLHAQNLLQAAPTQILFVPSVTHVSSSLEEYVVHDGTQLPAASGAQLHADSGLLVMGAVHGHGLMVCDAKHQL